MNLNYFIVPKDSDCPPYAYWDDAFSREELDLLQRRAAQAGIDAAVGGENRNAVVPDIRRSKISWVKCTSDTLWLFDRLSSVISELNSKFYRFELKGFGEDLQLTNYNEEDSGTYGWHIDRGDSKNRVRKLSAVLQLSEPGEYEGGDLEILYSSPDPIAVEKKRGRLVIFPSYAIHRVTPVLRGTRQSLVVWLFGEPLR